MKLYYATIEKQSDRHAMRQAEHHAGRNLLCNVLHCNADDILLHENGKPYLPGGPFFSLSHSSGFILLAVSDLGEIGCDVEDATRPLHNPEKLRQKIALPGEEDVPLLALWVKKEAIYKAGSAGLVYYPAMPQGFIAAVCCCEEGTPAPAEEMTI